MTRECALRFAGTAFALGLGTVPALADATIKWLHVEAVPETIAVWEEVADAYEAANPGVTIEMQFIENEAFKAKLPTLLQSSEAPASSTPGAAACSSSSRRPAPCAT